MTKDPTRLSPAPATTSIDSSFAVDPPYPTRESDQQVATTNAAVDAAPLVDSVPTQRESGAASVACCGWNVWTAGGIFLMLGLGGLVADLWTKSYMFEHHWPYHQNPNQWPISHEPHWWITGVFGIQTSTNGGALFGMMQGYQAVFVTLSGVALLGLMVWLFGFGAWRDRLLLGCLGLMTGGILGNLYDRLGFWHQPNTPADFHYHVRDWIHFRLAGVPYFDPWPNFNIADSLLVVGVILMLVHNFFYVGDAPKD